MFYSTMSITILARKNIQEGRYINTTKNLLIISEDGANMNIERKFTSKFFAVLMVIMAVMICSVSMKGEVSASRKTPGTVKITSARSDYKNSGVEIKWKKVKNAKYYDIAYDTSKKGKFKHWYSTDKRHSSITIGNYCLKPGKTYYFKVRAVNGKKVGKWSAVKSAKSVLATPEMYNIYLKSENTAEIDFYSCNGTNEIKGYELYRSTSKNSGYQKITTCKPNKSEYINKNLANGKVYYYKVRSYTKVSGKTVYSKFSNVKSIVIPKKVAINMGNWKDYFEIVPYTEFNKDSFGAITDVWYGYKIKLKSNYLISDNYYCETDIAYDVGYTEDQRKYSVNWTSGKVTIGSVIPDEYNNYPYADSTISNIGWSGESTIDSHIISKTSSRDYIVVARDFNMNRIQGTLYLKKW